jgi:hypothetical protein
MSATLFSTQVLAIPLKFFTNKTNCKNLNSNYGKICELVFHGFLFGVNCVWFEFEGNSNSN